MLSAAPVRQSDQGANVNSETATILITIVTSTIQRRPRSSEISCAFVVIIVVIWLRQQQGLHSARSFSRLTHAAMHQLDKSGFQQRGYNDRLHGSGCAS